jgi:hypothetical protein
MKSFLAAHRSEIKGVLSGWDRLRLRGTLRWLANRDGMGAYLGTKGILLKQFKGWAQGLTEKMRQATVRIAEAAGRPIEYLSSSQVRKEDRAKEIAEGDGITEGLICVLTCVEPCSTYQVGPNRQEKRLELRQHSGKCLHQYFYVQHPEWGLLSLRLQTWLPFSIHVCLNGREWLANSLRRERVGFVKRDNCFVDLADPNRAQWLLSQQLQTDWPKKLGELVTQFHPAHATMFESPTLDYYWSADETEWATDVLFHSGEALATLYPHLVRHAMLGMNCEDVLRFFGRPAAQQQYHAAQLQANLKRRHEGVRCKHHLNHNSIKIYDKQETVLRVETTINDARDIRVFRTPENKPDAAPSWLCLRKGVADLHRRAEVSQKANERYLESMATVEAETPLGEAMRDICQPTTWQGRRVRGLEPFTEPDMQLLNAVMRGEFALNGFRNRDLRELLFPQPTTDLQEQKRRASKVTRQIRMLRAHGLIHKIPRTHRYQLTDHGRVAIATLLAAQNASTKQLAKLAA